MIAYASRTGTKRNLDALRRRGWRLLISPKGVLRSEGFPYMLDNGAWSAFVAGEPFDEVAFMRAVERFGAGADMIVVPDIVAGGMRSLEFSLRWRERLLGIAPLLIAVQDGMTAADVRPVLDGCGIFIGGTTEWKEATMPEWGGLGAEVGVHVHAGRVNSVRRMHLCAAASVKSFDGSSASRFQLSLAKLDTARRALDLFAP